MITQLSSYASAPSLGTGDQPQLNSGVPQSSRPTVKLPLGNTRPGAKRSSHKNSRLGCGYCKKRKIKCDELKPVCSSCLASKKICEYPTSTAVAASTRSAIAPAAVRIHGKLQGRSKILSTASPSPTSSSYSSCSGSSNSSKTSTPSSCNSPDSGASFDDIENATWVPLSGFNNRHSSHGHLISSATRSRPPSPFHALTTAPITYTSFNFTIPHSPYLHHHFRTTTSLTLDLIELTTRNTTLWNTSIPHLALEYKFLQHGILGIAALHLLHLHTIRPAATAPPQHLQKLESLALYHKGECLRGFREEFGGPIHPLSVSPTASGHYGQPVPPTECDLEVGLVSSLIFVILGMFEYTPTGASRTSSSQDIPPHCSIFTPQASHPLPSTSFLLRWLFLYSGSRVMARNILARLGWDSEGQPLDWSRHGMTGIFKIVQESVVRITRGPVKEIFKVYADPPSALGPGGVVPWCLMRVVDVLVANRAGRPMARSALPADDLPPDIRRSLERYLNDPDERDALLSAIVYLGTVLQLVRSGQWSANDMRIYVISSPAILDERLVKLAVSGEKLALLVCLYLVGLLRVLLFTACGEKVGEEVEEDGQAPRGIGGTGERLNQWWIRGCSVERLGREIRDAFGYLGSDWAGVCGWVREIQGGLGIGDGESNPDARIENGSWIAVDDTHEEDGNGVREHSCGTGASTRAREKSKGRYAELIECIDRTCGCAHMGYKDEREREVGLHMAF